MSNAILCKIDGCVNKSHALGYCGQHYGRYRHHGDPLAGGPARVKGGANCCVDGCESKAASKSLCPKHLARFKKYGDPTKLRDKDKSPALWVMDNSKHSGDECLIWPFGVGDHGRGMVHAFGRSMSAPRYMCICAHGEPPTVKHVAAHSCGNGHLGCMNPKHLRWATQKENEFDKVAHGTLRKGSDINTSKLNEDQVLEIRSLRGVMKGVDIAKKFGITPAAVSAIQTRKNWGWI